MAKQGSSMVMKVLAFLAMALLVLPAGVQNSAAASNWTIGDVFAAVGNGQYKRYNNMGAIQETITQPISNGFTAGCAFNAPATGLYTTNFSNTKVFVFNTSTHLSTQTIDTAAQSPNGHSESIVFAQNTDFYVGHADGNHQLHKYNTGGTLQHAYSPAVELRGTDWNDLSADQMTMYYTSEGRHIKRFNVSSSGTQLGDFALLPGVGTAFALRLLPPGDGSGGLIVADNVDVKRLDPTGNVVQTYAVPGESSWFSVNLDPDGTSFWAGNFASGKFYRFNILTGVVDRTVDTMVAAQLFGLCVLGEPTAAVPRVCENDDEDNGRGMVADEHGQNGGEFDDDECDNNHEVRHKDDDHNMEFEGKGHGRASYDSSGLVATSIGQGFANGKLVNYVLVQRSGSGLLPSLYSLTLSDPTSGGVVYERTGPLIPGSGAINVRHQ